MNKARYLLGNINLINIMLTGVLIFLVNYMLLPFLNNSVQYTLPVIKKHEAMNAVTGKNPVQAKTPSPLDYVIITEQNIFHPTRKIPVEMRDAQPLPKPEFVLYGTLISDDLNIAYIEDKNSPVKSPGRGERQTPLKLGESLSGFILKELSEDRLVMVRGDERVTVYLVDPQKPKERGVTATASTPVAQDNRFGPTTPSRRLPQQITAPITSSGETAPRPPPSAEAREATRQKFMDLFQSRFKKPGM